MHERGAVPADACVCTVKVPADTYMYLYSKAGVGRSGERCLRLSMLDSEVKRSWQERGALLADMFLDHGLWERRLHFAVFQSAHLEDYIKCGLVDVAREEAGSSFLHPKSILLYSFFYTYFILHFFKVSYKVVSLFVS